MKLQLTIWLLLAAATCIGADEVTYYNKIRYIISANCLPCHGKNNVAPFTLESYTDVVAHASGIKRAITSKAMPPWSADANYKHFVNERLLSDSDIATLVDWINNKYPKGEYKPFEKTAVDKAMPAPSLVIKLPKVKLPANSRDSIIHFKVYYSIPSDTAAYAIRFVPGNQKMLHHANPILYNAEGDGYFAELSNMRRIETMQPNGTLAYETYYERDMDFFADYTPGRAIQTMPEGFTFNVSKKGYVLCQVHYGPSTIEFEDESSIELFFTDNNVNRVGEARKLGSGGDLAKPWPPLIIKADSISTYYINFTVPMDASVIIYSGHMHLLGKNFLAYATTPKNDTIPLLLINNYQFYLQEDCIPAQPIVLKKGYKIHVEATYDNTQSNILNPYNPPRDIVEGWRTVDEMMAFTMYMVKYLPGDENIVLGKLRAKH